MLFGILCLLSHRASVTGMGTNVTQVLQGSGYYTPEQKEHIHNLYKYGGCKCLCFDSEVGDVHACSPSLGNNCRLHDIESLTLEVKEKIISIHRSDSGAEWVRQASSLIYHYCSI